MKLANFLQKRIRGGRGGHAPSPPPGPVKINHKKDGRLRQPYRFHVSLPTSTMPLDPLLAKFCLKLSAAESGCSV